MARRKTLTSEGQARKVAAEELLKSADVNNPAELQTLIKEMMEQVIESSLEGELDEELGYTVCVKLAAMIDPTGKKSFVNIYGRNWSNPFGHSDISVKGTTFTYGAYNDNDKSQGIMSIIPSVNHQIKDH